MWFQANLYFRKHFHKTYYILFFHKHYKKIPENLVWLVMMPRKSAFKCFYDIFGIYNLSFLFLKNCDDVMYCHVISLLVLLNIYYRKETIMRYELIKQISSIKFHCKIYLSYLRFKTTNRNT